MTNVIRRVNLPRDAIQQIWVESLVEDGSKPYQVTARLKEGEDADRVIWDDVHFESNSEDEPLEGKLTLVGTSFASIRISFFAPAGTKVKLYQQVVVEKSGREKVVIREKKSLIVEAKENNYTNEKWLVCTVSE